MVKYSSSDTYRFLQVIGPGILYAAAAVGVSHLVQATRAGAIYGFEMAVVILLACLIKYPGLRFGSEYAAATGKSLVYGYAQTGRWAIAVYLLSQIFSAAFVIAAVSLVTAGLLQTLLGINGSTIFVVAGLLVGSAVLLISGRYHFLEKITKLIVILLTILLIISVVLIVQKQGFVESSFVLSRMDAPTLMFVIALMGFMPTPMDASVMQSLWTCAKSEQAGRRLTPSEVRLDFNIGFFMSFALAIFFMILGAGVMFGTGETFAASAGAFSSQVIGLFTKVIGDWSFYIIGFAATAAMLSTLITILDGYPRAAEAVVNTLFPRLNGKVAGFRFYDCAVILLCIAALLVITLFMKVFSTFIDLTAAIIFLTGPVIAFLNHHVMHRDEVLYEMRPSTVMRCWSWLGIITMLGITVIYFYVKLTN